MTQTVIFIFKFKLFEQVHKFKRSIALLVLLTQAYLRAVRKYNPAAVTQAHS